MNKTLLLTGIIFLVLGAVMLVLSVVLSGERISETEKVPCVDGYGNLIKNLPEDVYCEKKIVSDWSTILVPLGITFMLMGCILIYFGLRDIL